MMLWVLQLLSFVVDVMKITVAVVCVDIHNYVILLLSLLFLLTLVMQLML